MTCGPTNSDLLPQEGGVRFNAGGGHNTAPPIFSIVTVVCNDSVLLENTIKSVLSQKFELFEYIIIDGGSTDGTVDIIRSYQNSIAYWLSMPDDGIYDAMNKGAQSASGQWIHFLNAGDTFAHSDILTEIFNLVTDRTDFIYGHSYFCYGAGYYRLVKAKSLSCLWKGMPFSHQSLFVRSAILRGHPFDITWRFAADYNFVITVLSRCYGVLHDNAISSVVGFGRANREWEITLAETRDIALKAKNKRRVKYYHTMRFVFYRLKMIIKHFLPHCLVNLFFRLRTFLTC